MKDKKLQVGQKVWYVPDSRRGGAEPKEATVTKVGNKYFELDKKGYGKFHIDSLKVVSEYTTSARVYLNKQEYMDECEVHELTSKIRQLIGQYGNINLPLETLRKIHQLLTTSP